MRRTLSIIAGIHPNNLVAALRSWSKVEGLQDRIHNIIVSIEPSDVEDVMAKQVYSWLPAFSPIPVRVVEADRNKGGEELFWRALRRGFDVAASFVIVAPDDVVVGADVLAFMEHASTEYAEDGEVVGVSAYNDGRMQYHCDDPAHVQKVPIGESSFTSVWGTWKDRWVEGISDTSMATWAVMQVMNDTKVVTPCISRVGGTDSDYTGVQFYE